MGLLRRHFLFAFLSAALPLGAQQARITTTSEVRSAPSGTVVAELNAGSSWASGATRDGFTSVVIEAWVEASRFAGGRDSFPVTIGGGGNLRIREQPSLQGRILGSFRAGAGMRILERRDNWARVRREVWVPTSAVTVQVAASPRPPAAAPTPRQSTPTAAPARPTETAVPVAPPEPVMAPAPGSASVLKSDREVPLRLGPNGQVLGMLDSGVVVSAGARERGWVRVRIEGWAPESHFVPADTTYSATLSVADLRADPEGHRGKTVRWEVQVVGMQNADPLRRDMAANEPFLLAIGPAGEGATIYITVPERLMAEARAITPLSNVVLTARIRTGKSNPTGVPILEMISVAKP